MGSRKLVQRKGSLQKSLIRSSCYGMAIYAVCGLLQMYGRRAFLRSIQCKHSDTVGYQKVRLRLAWILMVYGIQTINNCKSSLVNRASMMCLFLDNILISTSHAYPTYEHFQISIRYHRPLPRSQPAELI